MDVIPPNDSQFERLPSAQHVFETLAIVAQRYGERVVGAYRTAPYHCRLTGQPEMVQQGISEIRSLPPHLSDTFDDPVWEPWSIEIVFDDPDLLKVVVLRSLAGGRIETELIVEPHVVPDISRQQIHELAIPDYSHDATALRALAAAIVGETSDDPMARQIADRLATFDMDATPHPDDMLAIFQLAVAFEERQPGTTTG